jgi:hypothetical protein
MVFRDSSQQLADLQLNPINHNGNYVEGIMPEERICIIGNIWSNIK